MFSSFNNLTQDPSFPGGPHIYLRDRHLGVTQLVDVSTDGTIGNSTTQNNAPRQMSSDGRFLVFQSAADNLVPNDTNGFKDVFLRDIVLGTTTRVSLSYLGAQLAGPTSSSDIVSIDDSGRHIQFDYLGSDAVPNDTNGVYDVFVIDTAGSSCQ